MMLMAGLEHWAPNTPCYEDTECVFVCVREKEREKREEENKAISKQYVLYFEPVGDPFDIPSPCWAEPDIEADRCLDTVNCAK